MDDALALRVAKKEDEIGKEYTDREIIAKYLGPASWAAYRVQEAKRRAKQNAMNSNIVHRFFSWITNYAFDKMETLSDELDQVMFEAGKDQIVTRKDEKTGEEYYDTEEHGDYFDTFI